MSLTSDAKGAFKREREEHKKLLAETHGVVMDLRWQIQHNEKNWNREKVELLDRLDRDRREWERQKKELLRRIEQVRSHLGVRNGWLQAHGIAPLLRSGQGQETILRSSTGRILVPWLHQCFSCYKTIYIHKGVKGKCS